MTMAYDPHADWRREDREALDQRMRRLDEWIENVRRVVSESQASYPDAR